MRILHLITGLGAGGAENMLLRLLREGQRLGVAGEPAVLSLTDRAALAPEIAALGVPLMQLGARSPARMPLYLPALLAAVRRTRPQLIQGWMVHGNLAASASRLVFPLGAPPVVWNIRQSLYDLSWERRSTAALIRFGAKISKQPAAILYNSATGAQHHEALGYARAKTLLVPNGFDTQRFRPDAEARGQVRAELGIDPDTPLVGLIGRWDAVKDHAGFVLGMAKLRQEVPGLRLLLAGSRIDAANDELAEILRRERLEDCTSLLGERGDIPRLNAALDVAVNASYTEAFANVVGEAMACGVPCAVTDVGESARLVGDAGEVVPAKDPAALAAAVGRLLALSAEARVELGLRARRRIVEHYSLARMVRRYDEIYRRLVAGESLSQLGDESSTGPVLIAEASEAADSGVDTASKSP